MAAVAYMDLKGPLTSSANTRFHVPTQVDIYIPHMKFIQVYFLVLSSLQQFYTLAYIFNFKWPLTFPNNKNSPERTDRT